MDFGLRKGARVFTSVVLYSVHVAGELVVPLTAVFMNSIGIGSSLGLELYFIANLTFGV